MIQPFLGCNKIPELLSYGVSTFWTVSGKHIGVSPWVGKGMDLNTTHQSQLWLFILVDEYLGEIKIENFEISKELDKKLLSSNCN